MATLAALIAHFRKSVLGLSAGLIAALIAAAVLGLITPFGARPPMDALFYINLFKLLVGVYCLLFAVYAYYGPMFHEAGLAKRLMPPEEIPVAVVVVYFALGALVLMTGLRAITLNVPFYLFGRVLAFSGFFGVATGFAVYCYSRAVERARHGR